MAKHGPSEITIMFDDAPGGTSRNITPYVTTIGGLAVESLTEQTNPFGVTSEQHTPVNLERTPDIPIGGFFDDAATVGPHVVFKITSADKLPGSVGRELIVTIYSSGAVFTVTVHLTKYEVGLKRDGLTEYNAMLKQKSAGVWS